MNLLTRLASLLLLACFVASTLAAAPAHLLLPRTAIGADELALIINDDDPLSRQIGDYYQRTRRIPAANVIHLHFPPGRSALSKDEFARLKAEIDQATAPHIQAYAIAWSAPYRVGCMSMTSALALEGWPPTCSRASTRDVNSWPMGKPAKRT